MTLRHLKIFMTVFETSNFTKAGEKLLMAQPAISLAIKELEDMYGVRLFERIRRNIYPTEQGKTLYQYATTLLAMYDEMNDIMRNLDEKSTIRIGSSITVSNYILPTLISEFKQLYPLTQTKVIIINSAILEDYLLHNQIDFALMESNPNSLDLTEIPFMQDHLCTIAHPDHPLAKQTAISLETIAKEDFLMREKGSSVREIVEGIFLTHDLHVSPLWESASTYALIGAVESNLGITTLPYHMMKYRYDESKLVRLDVPLLNITRDYNIVFYKNKYLTKPMQAFIKLCQQKGQTI